MWGGGECDNAVSGGKVGRMQPGAHSIPSCVVGRQQHPGLSICTPTHCQALPIIHPMQPTNPNSPARLLQPCNAHIATHCVLVAVADGCAGWLCQPPLNCVPHAGQWGTHDWLNALQELCCFHQVMFWREKWCARCATEECDHL